MGVVRAAHRLEYNSFSTYPFEDYLEFRHAKWHAGRHLYEHTVRLPHQMGTTVEL
jgi:hypothetical protein